MSEQERTVPYFNLYASDFVAYKGKLSDAEMVEVLLAICDICLFGDSNFKSENFFQMRYFEKIRNDLSRSAKKYSASVENGRKGGRPRKQKETQEKPIGFLSETQLEPDKNLNETNIIEYNKIEDNIIEDDKIEDNSKKVDAFFDPLIEKCFNIYSEICTNLPSLKFEKKNKNIREMLSEYLYETNNDLNYFKEVCIKANEQKQICDVKLDFKSVIKNHISIYNEKFKKSDAGNVISKLKFN
jgi:hypothetical protein